MDKPTLTPHVNLSLTREACGIILTEMAAMIGSSASKFNKIDSGDISCVKFSTEICRLLGITWEELSLRVLEYSENIKARVVVVLMKRKQMINEVNHRTEDQLDLPLNARAVKPEARMSQVAWYSEILFPDPLVRDGINFTISKDDCHLIGIALQVAGGGA